MGNCSSKENVERNQSNPNHGTTSTAAPASNQHHHQHHQHQNTNTNTNQARTNNDHNNPDSNQNNTAIPHPNGPNNPHSSNHNSNHSSKPITNNQITKINYPSLSLTHERKWKFLHTHYSAKIVDPADVHCVLDECLKETIHKLHSAEMTLLSRRVRKVVRKLLASDSNANGNNSMAMGKGMGMGMGIGNIIPTISASSSSSPTKTSKKTFLKKPKLSSANNNTDNNNSNNNNNTIHSNNYSNNSNNNHNSTTATPTVTPLSQLTPSQAENRSKQIYAKHNVLDEYVTTQIFMGGYQILCIGSSENWTQLSLDLYLTRQLNKKKKQQQQKQQQKQKQQQQQQQASGGNNVGNVKNDSVRLLGSFDNSTIASEQVSDLSGIAASMSTGMNMSMRTTTTTASDTKDQISNKYHRDKHTIHEKKDQSASLRNHEENGRGNNGGWRKHKSKSKNNNNNNATATSSPSKRLGRRRTNHNNNATASATVTTNTTQFNHVSKHNPKNISTTTTTNVANVFGNAYQLLLYLSEQRWDHVADIAKLSAENADLILDVNEQIRLKEHLKYMASTATYTSTTTNTTTTNNNNNNNDSNTLSSPRSSIRIPSPPPEYPSDKNYKNLPLTPPPSKIPNGITLQEISYLVASALRGSRRKRLTLLFYLLLKQDTLVNVLDSHPAGGVPTWLLEVDHDWILSYASLSHYFYYGGLPPCSSHVNGKNGSSTNGRRGSGNMKSFFSPTSASSSSSAPSSLPQASNRNAEFEFSTASLKELKVDILCVIETIAVLLHIIPKQSSNINDDGNDMKSDMPISLQRKTLNQPNRARTLSYSDTKYHAANMHLMLTDYLRKLQQNPHNAPVFDSDAEQFHKLEMLDKFWDESKSIYAKCKQHIGSNNNGTGEELSLSWTMEEFMNWADCALPSDTVLDHIMHQLFGLGLLPTPAMERKLVCESWVDWQLQESRFFDFTQDENYDTFSFMTLGIKNLLSFSTNSKDGQGTQLVDLAGVTSDDEDDAFAFILGDVSAVWGGVGGFDGRGGLGYGLMYCIDKKWWDRWASYVGWEWNDGQSEIISRVRPHGLNTEDLIETNIVGRGTLGSYELMKRGLKKGVDYVLVPPRVWDILYELYGGGPPLPRMVLKISNSVADIASIDMVPHDKQTEKPMRVPKALNVLTHPWIIECRVCDPHQPYRRGDVGPTSIRIMVSPNQFLWRLFSEIVVRLPIIHPWGKNTNGRGCARLWRRVESTQDVQQSTTSQTYGPWELLCKAEAAEIPVSESINFDRETYIHFQKCWETYAANQTVESIGLRDGDKLLFEYALVGKDGDFTWPREAAAKAGKQMRDNIDDQLFRRKLRGLDAKGKLLKNTKALIGTVVDAMDSSGRWYQAEITDVDNSSRDGTDMESDDETCASETVDERQGSPQNPGEIRAIRVDFSEVGGDEEWILVSSDRLAVRERFTLDSMKSVDQFDSGKTNNQSKSYSLVLRKNNMKKSNSFKPLSSGCSYPGFGACGLYNLGNTCYSNSALQCLTYIPLLRAYLLSGQFERNGDLNRDNPLGTGGQVLEEYAELLRIMWSGKSGALQPLKFRHSLVRAKQRYSGTEQQDAQELLNDILDILHEDSNRVLKKPYVEAIEDEWVSNTALYRVGEETWRRYMRRNRSIIADLCMGQVLNRVTCPTCNHTSRIFEPFNMLSLPFPDITEVFFRCIVIRRASVLNCSKSLISTEKAKMRFQRFPKQSVAEEFIVPMSRVADISELKGNLVKICGISGDKLKIYTVTSGSVEDISSNSLSFGILQDKQMGPCWQFAQSDKSDGSLNKTTTILAFELTLCPRPGLISSQDRGPSKKHKSPNDNSQHLSIDETLQLYGDDLECHLFDTNPSYLSKAISQILWPKSALDFVVGLRVDAIDQRNKWFPGTIVEVSFSGNGKRNTSTQAKGKDAAFYVKVHFDNFSSKWDLSYNFEEIRKGNVLPLYSNVLPKDVPFEIQIFHSQTHDPFNFFGLPFFVHYYVEWTSARAGAHILAQTARFLESDNRTILFHNDDKMQFSKKYSNNSDVLKKIKEAQSAISKTIDVLVDADKRYINLLLRASPNSDSALSEKVAMLKAKLERKMNLLIPILPFNVMIYNKDQSSTTNMNKGVLSPFIFTLDRTIGNCMNARQEIVVCWKEVKKVTRDEIISYHSPLPIDIHQKSHEYMKNKHNHLMEINGGSGQNGMNLGSCLNEFCNEQQLDESECWRCPMCKELREGKQRMTLWRLPDVLTFHLKRFNCSARWREKITNKVNFPLTGLNMKEWCDNQSPLADDLDDDCIYDLIGVVNHYGGMTSGHYTAVTKATACSPEGSEEVEHYFNGAGVHAFGGSDEKEMQPAIWKLMRSKEKDANSTQAKAAQAWAKSTAESSEPLWLHFDDESVEPIPPSEVVSPTAYVLFYRRRRITPSNIAKYSINE